MDPTDQQLKAALKAALTIKGKGEFYMNFISAFCEGMLE
jgi:hypothetical protein